MILIIKRIFGCLGALAAVLALLSAQPALAKDPDKVQVVATFSILGDIAHQLAGDWIELKTLVGPDADAHTYQIGRAHV